MFGVFEFDVLKILEGLRIAECLNNNKRKQALDDSLYE
jgi:hypothetical protein